MTESIGTARLDIVVDTSKFDAGINSAKRSTTELAKATTQASTSMEGGTKRQVAALERQIATLGKSREEIIRWRIEQQTSGKVSADLAAKLDAQVRHLNNGGKAMNAYGISAKQTAAALRGVPAQLTDIFTSIQGGQRPLTVLFQQGGQLKDMFGGIVPAARALAGSILNLVNPYTLAAAAVVGIGAAYHEATSESAEFNKALILTGNNAGLSVKQLHDMAEEIGRTTSASAIGASDTLAKVAATGRFTADQIGLVAKAATNMQVVSGAAIEDTIAQFVQLQNDPLEAILKLNDAQHFLTQSTVRQIEEFVKQGREADAAALAIKAWADTINTRAPEAEQNLSGFAKVLRSIKDAAADDAAAIVGMFAAAENGMAGFVARHEQLINKLKEFSQYVPLFGGTFATLDPSKPSVPHQARSPQFANVVNDSVVNSAAERKRIKDLGEAQTRWDQKHNENRSKAKQIEDEINQIKADGLKLGKKQGEIDKEVAEAQARYKESLPKGKKPRKESVSEIQNASDRFDDMTGRFRTELQGPLQKVEEDHIRRLRELEQAAAKGKRSHEDLANAVSLEGEAYKKASEEIKHNLESQVAGLSGPMAQAQNDHAERLRQIDVLQKQLSLSGDQVAAMLREEAKSFDDASAAAARAADPIGALLSDMQTEIDLIGKSNAERAVMIELRRNHIDVMSAEGQAALATARAFETEAEAKQQSIDLMDDFRRGAADALSDFVTGAKSAKDALKDFFDEMAQQITKAIANQWIKQLFGQQGSDGSGTSGEGIFGAIMSLFGSGGGEQWYANGGAFSGGVQKFATGGVFDSPTMFGMAGGRMGVMGEAGPEAVMPLHRGPDGKLGVRMAANDDATPRKAGPTTVNQTIVVQGRIDSRTPGQFAQATAREQNRASNRNR